MEEITFEDILTHYSLKLKETSDEVETIKNLLKKAEGSIDSGWTGSAADACGLKLESVNGDLAKTLTEISEALIKLSAISESFAEENITTV